MMMNKEFQLSNADRIVDWVDIFRKFASKKDPFRCKECGRLLAYEKILLGAIDIKCPRCKSNNKIYFDDIEDIKNIIDGAGTKNKK